MKLLELHILEFGALKDRHISLGDGLNVLWGENESGKSTIMLFIKFMLYGLPKRGHAERERAISRDGHRAAGVMTLRSGDEDYRIERSFVDAGRGSEKLTVYRVRDGEKVFAGEEPGEALLKVPKEIFESSCGIGQMQCAGLGGKKEAAAIQNLLSSADESVDIGRVEKRLDDIRILYRHKRGEGGKLYELSEQIHREQQRLERATENRLRIEELQEKLRKNGEQCVENEEALRRAEAVLTECGKVQILRRFDALRENEARYEEIDGTLKEWTERGLRTEHMPVSTDVARLNMLADSLERADWTLAEAESREAALKRAPRYDEEAARMGERIEKDGGASELLRRVRRFELRAKLGTAGTVAGLLAAVLGVILCVAWTLVAGLTVAAVGVLLLGIALPVGMGGRKQVNALARDYGSAPDALSEALARFSEAVRDKRSHEEALAKSAETVERGRAHVAQLRNDLTNAMAKTAPDGEATSEGARREAARLEAFLSEYRRLQQQRDVLRVALENDRQSLSNYDEEELRSSLSLSEEEVANISKEMMAKAENSRKFYAERARALRESERQWRMELGNLLANAEEPLLIADRLAALRNEREQSEFYYDALVIAQEGIRQAAESMSGNITPAISRNAGKMMDYISDGRYGEIRMGGSLNVSLVEADGRTASAEMMSGGTRDAAYLTLRIALMMQIFGGELPPLMMDESLCQLDDSRMKRILALVGKLCEERFQCLLFSCHTREASACREMQISFTEIPLK